MPIAAALEEIAGIRDELDRAADRLLGLAERGLLEAGPAAAPILTEILEACAFGDLIGQRLTRLANTMSGAPDGRSDAHLLNGPSSSGLDQSAVDAAFSEGASRS